MEYSDKQLKNNFVKKKRDNERIKSQHFRALSDGFMSFMCLSKPSHVEEGALG